MYENQHSLPLGYWLEKALEPGCGHDWGMHTEGILTLVVDGALRESFPQRVDDCSPLELHWKPPGAVHRTVAGPDGVRMVLIALRPELVAQSPLARRRESTVVPVGPASVRALRLLRDPASTRRALAEQDVPGWADELLASAAGRRHDRAPAWLERAKRWAGEQDHDPPSMAAIARVAGVHPGSLGRAFRRHFGTTLGEFLQARRLDRAIDRLAEPSLSLAGVAVEAGFYDQSHFHRAFRRHTGWTPGRFRRSLTRLRG